VGGRERGGARGRRSRLSIGGDSSGVNLAGVVTLVVRGEGGPALVAQVLEILAFDLTMSQPAVTGVSGPVVLTRDDVADNIARYADPEDHAHLAPPRTSAQG
jgi:acetyl esterase